MADYAIPKASTAYIFYGCLVSQADTKLFKSAPTLAAGDFKVSIDGGAFANLATLPTNTPGTFAVKFSLSAGEMAGDNILVVASDAAGAEWCDQSWNIQTTARGVADLAWPTVSGRSLDISATGEAGVDWANVGSPTTTLALTGTTIATTQKVDVETIKTNPVVNGGTITFPTTATLASTTNITAGTVATATNVTTVNGLAAGVITAASIAADAITAAKIADGAIDALTFAAGAINAAAIAADAITDAKVASDVTIASVTGAVGSVTGAVGSVTGNVGGNVTGTIGGFTTAAKAEIQTEAEDAIVTHRLDELLNADSDIDGVAPPTVGSVFHELLTKTAGSFTYDQTTDSLEALRDRGDAAWTTATGFSTHSAADVWAVATRVLTAGTNIQLPSNGLANVTAWTVALTGNITGNLSGSVGSVTGAVGSIGTGGIAAASFAAGAIDAAALAADAGTEIGTAVWATTTRQLTAAGLNLVLVDGVALPTALQYACASVAGKVSGAGTGSEVFKGLDGTTTRLTVTVDSSGNRSGITYG